jgi:hypothetical protein
MPPPSEPLLDRYRACHDALLEARFTKMAIYSTTLCTIPLHVIKIVQHDFKPPPLAYKRRGRSPSRGERTTSTFITPLYKHYGATQYSASSTPLLDVRPRPEPG